MTSNASKKQSAGAAGLRVAVWVGLSNKKCLEKLRGLDSCGAVGSGILFRRYPLAGLDRFRQVCPPPVLRVSAFLSHLYALLATIPCCFRFRPDVCIGISLSPHAVMAKIGQVVSGSSSVNWLLGTDIYSHLTHKWWGRALRRTLRRAGCTITMGNGSCRALEDMGWPRARLLVGRNAYDFSQLETPAQTENEKEWDVIYTGRLDRYAKRLHILLQAVDRLRTSRPGIKCVIAGQGPDMQRLVDIRDELGLQSAVEFVGHRDDIVNLLQKSRILAMTSAWEGLPASIIEAFACGLPVVAPDVGDISDLVVDGDNGILVRSNRSGDYAGALTELLDNPGEYERMSRAARRTGKRVMHEIENGVPAGKWRKALNTALTCK